MGKKLTSWLLCVILCLGVMTGCGGGTDKSPETQAESKAQTEARSTEAKARESTEAAVETEAPAKTEAPAGETTEAAADVPDYMTGDPVELKLVIYGDNNDANEAYIKDKLRPRLIEELNIGLSLDFMSWGAADQVRTMAMSGEAFGFMFDPNANPWSSDGIMAIIPYEDIERLAPDYLDARGSNGFEWCKDPDGNIIAFPLRSMPNPELDGIAVRNDMLKAVDLDYTMIKTWDDYINAAQKVKENSPEVYVGHLGVVPESRLGIPAGEYYTPVGGINFAGICLNGAGALAMVEESDPESDEVFSMVETEWFRERCRVAEEMIELGLRPEDPLVQNEFDMSAWNSGNGLFSTAYTQMIYRFDELSGVEGSEVKVIRWENHQDILKLDYNWTIAASIEEQDNINHWIRLVNWMYESRENNYFISKGEEGVDWEFAEDGVAINKLTDVNLVHDWMIATDKFEEVSTQKYGEEPVAEYWALNDTAIHSKAMGFVFDPKPVETEAALLQAIATEDLAMYLGGYRSVDDGFDELLQKMKDQGMDAYIAEVQKQFSEFMAGKN